MDIQDFIYSRRSIRRYEDKKVPEDTLIEVVKAGTSAPTAANCQPWEFIIINQENILEELRDKCVFARYNAPAAIIVCGNLQLAFKGKAKEFWVQDCSAAIENMLLSARGFDLGTVWIGVYPLEAHVNTVRKIADIPDYVVPLGIVYIGYPAESKESRTRYNEKRVYWQKYDPKRKHRAKDKPVMGHY